MPRNPAGTQIPESLADRSELARPDQQALIADSIGSAMLIVLDTLSPPEGVAFVLHDISGVSFQEIAPIIGKTAAASRQLGSRAGRRALVARLYGQPGRADRMLTWSSCVRSSG